MVLLFRRLASIQYILLEEYVLWGILLVVDFGLLAALAEPNRLRIVELLGESPRPVGEIATRLELRQPQVTKHLQTLGRTGLVVVHPLGRRRVYALRRERLRELADWLSGFEATHPSENVLVQYRAAIEAEQALSEQQRRAPRTFRFERELPALSSRVWRAWTTAELVRRWWSPEHFEVADCEVDAVPGGRLSIALIEGDGTRHEAAGRFLALSRPRSLRFELAPLDPSGQPLFRAVHEVRLAQRGQRTRLALTIHVRDVQREAAPAVAGIALGWEQTLDKLNAQLRRR
jgi:uncharacterized protein YndB with AHSA1/START domain/DNA-binding transcriptional ArsR family regulator